MQFPLIERQRSPHRAIHVYGFHEITVFHHLAAVQTPTEDILFDAGKSIIVIICHVSTAMHTL